MMPIHSSEFIYSIAIIIGIVAGMRSLMAPAVLALTLSRRHELVPALAPAQWLALTPVAWLLVVAEFGEIVGDKLPMTPNRTAVGPLLARMITGGLSGAVVAQVGQQAGWAGAAFGIAGALIGSFGGFHARRMVGRVTKMRDPIVGAVEDVVALAIAAGAMAALIG